MWYQLAERYPDVKFLAFTKQWDIVRDIPFDSLPNFALVLSGWPGTEIPEDLKKRYHASYCIDKGDTPPEGAIECNGNCMTCNACWMLKDLDRDVWFRKH